MLPTGGQKPHAPIQTKERLEKAIRVRVGDGQRPRPLAATRRMHQPVTGSGFDEPQSGVCEKPLDRGGRRRSFLVAVVVDIGDLNQRLPPSPFRGWFRRLQRLPIPKFFFPVARRAIL